MNTALTPYIEHALLTRHYCYVPGLGAFMSREVAGTVSASADGTCRLGAPRREVTFNARMSHDDGELTVLVAEDRGIPYPQAEAFVRQEVAAIRRHLAQTDGPCPLGIVGQLYGVRDAESDAEGLRFVPAPQHHLAEGCGLADLRLPTWRQLERERLRAATPHVAPPAAGPAIRTDREHIHISVPRRWVRHVAVIVLIVCAFFVTPLPADHPGNSEYAAMPLAALQSFQRLDTRVWQSWSDEWETPEALDAVQALGAADADSTDTAGLAAGSPLATAVPATAPTPAAVPAAGASPRRYCIIVRSGTSRRQIEAERDALQRQGYDKAAVIERDGRYRLCIDAFDAKDEALHYLEALRGRQGYGDAWILPLGRPSQIIKNPDNDGNQLSMELSHPKHRTASDKG